MNNRIEKIKEEELDKDESAETSTNGTADQEQDKSQAPEPDEKEHEPRETAGVILKKEREKQGLTLEIVHETTKIPLDALRAIEEGYKIRMLSPFYYSGFVKMYAKYLNIDISEVFEDYKKEEPAETVDEEDDDFEMPQWVTKGLTKERKHQIAIAAGAVVALFLLFKMVAFIASIRPKASAKTPTKVTAVKKEVKKAAETPPRDIPRETPKIKASMTAPKIVPPPIPKSSEKPKAQPAPEPTVAPKADVPPKPAPSAAPPLSAAASKNVNLTVRANQNSWLRVKTDGEVVFQSTLRTGAVETWLADQEIEISGRNINQLEFELNGKLIGTLGRKDRNAKKVIITKDGLSVEK